MIGARRARTVGDLGGDLVLVDDRGLRWGEGSGEDSSDTMTARADDERVDRDRAAPRTGGSGVLDVLGAPSQPTPRVAKN